MSDREASEFDEIREELSRRPGSKFGWVVYRCTYGDDARWAEFMDLLTGYVKVEAEISSNLDLMGSLDWAVQEDRALDEATPAAVRRRFQRWVAETQEPTVSTPRFNYCLMVDRDAMQSVLDGPPPQARDLFGNEHVILVAKDWEPEAENEHLADGDDEPTEELSEEPGDSDSGWFKLQICYVLPLMYDRLRSGSWDTWYESPPSIVTPT